ncbi:MAG: hemolysin III family protein [Candidatus Gallimonas sp.]
MQTATVGLKDRKETKSGFRSFYTKGEEIFNAVSHIAGGALGVAALALGLIFAYPDGVKMAALSVFAACVVVLYTMSALYHFLPNGRAKGVFRVFDHCTIFLLIAGTYTPYCLIALGGTAVGAGVLIAEWVLAAIGIAGNAIAMNNRIVKITSMGAYVGMGWAVVVGFRPLLETISPACFWLLLSGGIAYTAGIAFYAFGKKVKYFHSVWHLFDLAGTVLHFISILLML